MDDFSFTLGCHTQKERTRTAGLIRGSFCHGASHVGSQEETCYLWPSQRECLSAVPRQRMPYLSNTRRGFVLVGPTKVFSHCKRQGDYSTSVPYHTISYYRTSQDMFFIILPHRTCDQCASQKGSSLLGLTKRTCFISVPTMEFCTMQPHSGVIH